MKNGLIVFAREPLPGKVKNRLAAAVGAERAAGIYETMLQDVLAATRQLQSVNAVVYWASAKESLPFLAERFGCSSRLQSSGDLGQRMQGAFEEMLADGCDHCCIIGSDAPDLPVAYIEEAYLKLADQATDVVIGPCRDGGYYLLGLKKMCERLFMDIPWSSAQVFERSIAAARNAGLSFSILPEWHDIDTIEDYRAFCERQQTLLAACT